MDKSRFDDDPGPAGSLNNGTGVVTSMVLPSVSVIDVQVVSPSGTSMSMVMRVRMAMVRSSRKTYADRTRRSYSDAVSGGAGIYRHGPDSRYGRAQSDIMALPERGAAVAREGRHGRHSRYG